MSTLNKWIRKVATMFKEKPQVKSDDYELEHLLIYHSLVGTTPENQRDFKDVKSDVELAWANESSAQMAIALKLPPLWWDEKLKAILAELGGREAFIACLAPDVPEDRFDLSAVPLLHEDWRVRANAAILLSYLQAENVESKLVQSLHDTASSAARTAFPHQAYALARLGGAEARKALEQYLVDAESWMRVDAAGALAIMDDGRLSEALMKAVLDKHLLSNYVAVVIARSVDLQALLASSDRLEITAGSRLIEGILESSRKTFPIETVTETRASECLPQLFKLVGEGKSVTAASACFALAKWLDVNHSYALLAPPPPGLVEEALDFLSSPAFQTQLLDQLKTLKESGWENDPVTKSELQSAIELSGQLHLKDAVQVLLPFIAQENQWLTESIESIGLSGDWLPDHEKETAGTRLIDVAKAIVNLEERQNRDDLQAHPVFEEDEKGATTYWRILTTLGNLPSDNSFQFLIEATKDFAPDKRVEAYRSLIKTAVALSAKSEKKDNVLTQVNECISKGLNDPSIEVRKAALSGVHELSLTDDLKRIVKLTSSKELSVVKEAFNSLSELAKKGHKAPVLKALDQGLKVEADLHKRQHLKKFIDSIGTNAPDSTS